MQDGDDDCGDDLSGLGKDINLLGYDFLYEEIDTTDDDDDDDLFVEIPKSVPTGEANVFSAITSLCYGRHNQVDIIELCGGTGRVSQVAFKRGLISGGNLDLTTDCDLGDPKVQQAIDHYLDTCDVLVAIIQPNCRTTGPPSYVNHEHNHDTWQKHHNQDLPHLKYCGHVAQKQVQRGFHYLREQPAGTWLDSISPWFELERSTEQ